MLDISHFSVKAVVNGRRAARSVRRGGPLLNEFFGPRKTNSRSLPETMLSTQSPKRTYALRTILRVAAKGTHPNYTQK